jgi:hypothetical protein
MKYIKICQGSVRVKIERGDDEHLRHFPIRSYPSLEAARVAAIQWRDETHLKVYGIPVTEKVIQVTSRQKQISPVDPKTGERLPDLGTGLSYGFHRGRLLYVVASYQENSRAKRKRFSILKLGISEAIQMARDFRLASLKQST